MNVKKPQRPVCFTEILRRQVFNWVTFNNAMKIIAARASSPSNGVVINVCDPTDFRRARFSQSGLVAPREAARPEAFVDLRWGEGRSKTQSDTFRQLHQVSL